MSDSHSRGRAVSRQFWLSAVNGCATDYVTLEWGMPKNSSYCISCLTSFGVQVSISLCRVGRENDARVLYLGLRHSLERVEPWWQQDFIPPLCLCVWFCRSPQWDNWCPWTRWKLSFLFGYWILCFVFFWVIIYGDSELNWLIEGNDRHPEGNWLPSQEQSHPF